MAAPLLGDEKYSLINQSVLYVCLNIFTFYVPEVPLSSSHSGGHNTHQLRMVCINNFYVEPLKSMGWAPPLIPQSIHTKCMLKYLSAASMDAMAYCVEVVSMREKEVPFSRWLLNVYSSPVRMDRSGREGGGLQNGKIGGPKTF